MSIDLSRVRFGSAFGPISPYPTVLLRANRGTDNRSQRSGRGSILLASPGHGWDCFL
jgi:hypothetical protein